VQRYAAVGHGQGPLLRQGVHLRYVVANPSSYLYFTSDRPIDVNRRTDGTTIPCPKANRWEYGLDGGPPSYVSQPVDPQALERDSLRAMSSICSGHPTTIQRTINSTAHVRPRPREPPVSTGELATFPTCRRAHTVNGRNGFWRCPVSDITAPRCSPRSVAVLPCSTRRAARRDRRRGLRLTGRAAATPALADTEPPSSSVGVPRCSHLLVPAHRSTQPSR
jgi:hypothetical protein